MTTPSPCAQEAAKEIFRKGFGDVGATGVTTAKQDEGFINEIAAIIQSAMDDARAGQQQPMSTFPTGTKVLAWITGGWMITTRKYSALTCWRPLPPPPNSEPGDE